jgi:hypothetical protein
LMTRIISLKEYRPQSSSLCSFLHSPATSSLLGPNISTAPCSVTPSAYVLPSVWATKFHICTKQQAKLTLIFKFLDSKLEDKRFCTEW